MRFYKTKVDMKGRVSLPMEIRNIVDMRYGDELVLETAGNRELVISPVAMRKANTSVKIVFTDFSSGFRKAMKTLVAHKADILRSESKSDDGSVHWNALVRMNHSQIQKLTKRLEKIEGIAGLKITKEE
ncbi:MAG: AbrB/MazE/SpoVT family DNA-binding domain-containing protein [Candidatus Aenigmarchaeota archaeon]|nr:AbrB/MazE/SpoVT family DNA-binding domain-containing protein [Candidatus Aenigmarchaeota archaeon]